MRPLFKKLFLLFIAAVAVTGCAGNSHEIRDPSGVEVTTARSGPLGTTVVSESDQYASEYQYCLKMQSGRADAAEQCRHLGNIRDPGPRCQFVWYGFMAYEVCPGQPPRQASAPMMVYTPSRPYQPGIGYGY